MAQDAKAQEERCNSLNTYLFNLIVYSPVKERSQYFYSLVEHIADHFPSRILFIEGAAEEQQGIATEYHGVEQGEGCEQITFKVPQDQRDKISFVILPHLLSDLPVVSLWGQDPTTEQDVLPHLVKFSSRLIFDSDSADNLQRFSHRILALADASLVDLVDLNWARIKGWRDAFDEVFDSPARLEQLSLAKKITITYNGSKNQYQRCSAIQALYLQAWLAAQLGWKARHLEPADPITKIVYFNGVNDMHLELVSNEAKELPSGSILGIEIEGGHDQSFSLRLAPGMQQAIVHISSLEACELPFNVMISGPRLRYQFVKDLMYGRSSQHYLGTLHLLSQQDWKR